MTHTWVKIAVVAPIAAATAVVPADIAGATNYPSGCSTLAAGGWSDNCWVGYGYSETSYMVTASQTVSRLYPHFYCYFTPFLARDGVYGTSTKNAIKLWQEGYNDFTGAGLAEDGVVGTQTWAVWDNWIASTHYSYTDGGYKYYRNDVVSCPLLEDTRAFFRSGSSSPYYWEVLLSGGTTWAYMWS